MADQDMDTTGDVEGKGRGRGEDKDEDTSSHKAGNAAAKADRCGASMALPTALIVAASTPEGRTESLDRARPLRSRVVKAQLRPPSSSMNRHPDP